MRLPRALSLFALAGAIAVPVYTIRAQAPAPAQPGAAQPPGQAAPAPAGQPAAQPTNPDQPPALPGRDQPNPLNTAAENYWFYAKVAKYPLAVQAGEQVLAAGAQPGDVLAAFEKVANDRGDNLYETLYRWLNVEPMRDTTQKIINTLKQGEQGRYSDPKWIAQQIERLSVNERAFMMALDELRNSGEYAAAVGIDYLRDPNKRQFHARTRDALVRLGRTLLNPLVAVLESKDKGTLITTIGILGDIGYPSAAPYIQRVYETQQPGMEQVKAAAAVALAKLGVANPQQTKAADLFVDLGEKFYYGNATITNDQRFTDSANIWFWDDSTGLNPKKVPTPIFNERMAMRCAEYALKLQPDRGDAISLWLASNNRREVELPEGATDPTHQGPDAHFYNVSYGAQYLNQVLARALQDKTAGVALKAIKSMQEIMGQSNMGAGAAAGKLPIVDSLRFPDRLVRFEGAMTIAQALPQQPFEGMEQVVPTLADAVSTTGKANVLIVAPTLDAANGLKESLKDAYRMDAAADANEANTAAGRLGNVDVAVIDVRGAKEADAIVGAARIADAPKVIIIQDNSSPFAGAALNSVLINTIVAGTGPVAGDQLTAAINKARARAGAPPLDEKISEAYALRAAQLLERVGISRGQVLDVSLAANALMRALEDPRAEIAKSSAGVLGLINSKEAQASIAAKATDDKTAPDLKIACFKGVARSAKFFGNQLDGQTVDAIQKTAESAQDAAVKSAAAEAMGALNLPPERAKNLIVNQSQVGK
jgi:hypothetical protein